MTVPSSPQQGDVIYMEGQEHMVCDKCNEEPIVNIPYTWDTEMQAYGRAELGYTAKCPECLKRTPNNPGLLILFSLPRWIRLEAKRARGVFSVRWWELRSWPGGSRGTSQWTNEYILDMYMRAVLERGL